MIKYSCMVISFRLKEENERESERRKTEMKTVHRRTFFIPQQHRFKIALFDVPLVVLADELTNLFGSILSTIIDRQSKLDTVDVE